MPWKEQTAMSQRKAFIKKATQQDRNMSQLCREFGISRKTGYKWLKRYLEKGETGLKDQSRRPKHSPRRTQRAIEELVLRMRAQHPVWGGRKLHARLKALGYKHVPSPSTITAILQRHDCIHQEASLKRQRIVRFEKDRPNQMWQMDFKAPLAINGTNCTPLTIIDDYSRFLLCLQICVRQNRETVQEHLTNVFRRFGLPEAILTDNGPPWGPADGTPYYTRLSVWLMRLGIRVIRSRPYHPQTLGKDERLHRSLQEEVLDLRSFSSLQECQDQFDHWQQVYNTQRPHEALNLKPPHTRFRPSPRRYPEEFPPIAYSKNHLVRSVDLSGRVSFHNVNYKVGKAFAELPVGLVSSLEREDALEVYFSKQHIKTIILK